MVDSAVWKSAAGVSVSVPSVNSRVYYFPQGYCEQSLSPISLSPISPMVPCRVSYLAFLANPETDEVFARIRLIPYPCSVENANGADDDVAQMVSFGKVLTPSDANNGGGFSVPRFCADSVFPPLDFNADPPVQNINVHDIHGTTWQFRHIYRGTPRRHLLTTGWSKFVNSKKLVAGDSVVFMRNVGNGELYAGIRRAVRDRGTPRVTPEMVVEAAEKAARGEEFEVVWYPSAGCGGEFVVGAEVVEESLNMIWMAGMKAKMAMETDDSSRVTWFQGTVENALVPDTGPWRGSPWKMLQVAWDEPEFLQHLQRVSPWQVEHCIPPSPPHFTHPTKKSRITQNTRLQTDVVQDLPFPILGLSNSLMGNFNSSMMSYCSLPASMQGARQSQVFVSSLSNLIDDNTNQICGHNTFGNNMSIQLKSVSTEPNIQSPQSEILSPDSQSSLYLFGTEIVGKQGCVSSKKAGLSSFQLFGKTIHVKDSAESNSDDTVSAEGNGVTMIEEAECVKTSSGVSFTVPDRNLLDGIDYQRPSAPAVETFSLS